MLQGAGGQCCSQLWCFSSHIHTGHGLCPRFSACRSQELRARPWGTARGPTQAEQPGVQSMAAAEAATVCRPSVDCRLNGSKAPNEELSIRQAILVLLLIPQTANSSAPLSSRKTKIRRRIWRTQGSTHMWTRWSLRGRHWRRSWRRA